MTDYQPLTTEQVNHIVLAYYQKRREKSQPQETPCLFLVGGQPGAGKSAASTIGKLELSKRGGYLHIDADRMRERIPIGNSKPTSDQTQKDAGKLVAALRELAIQERRNILEEGTFRNADDAKRFIQDKKEKSYQIELLVVATPREESLLGIYQRFEQQHYEDAENPRFVPTAYHDNAMKGFENTLSKVTLLLDHIRVVNRTGEILFDSFFQENQYETALETLIEAHKLSNKKRIEIIKAWEHIENAAKNRHATLDYLNEIKTHKNRLILLLD